MTEQEFKAKYDEFISTFTSPGSNLAETMFFDISKMWNECKHDEYEESVEEVFERYLCILITARRPWLFTGFVNHERLTRKDFTSLDAWARYKTEWESKDEKCAALMKKLQKAHEDYSNSHRFWSCMFLMLWSFTLLAIHSIIKV